MSMYLYLSLTEEDLANIAKQQGTIRPGQAVMLGLTPITIDADGRPYHVVRNADAPKGVLIPVSLRDRVECVSWRVCLPQGVALKVGTYSNVTASATVEAGANGTRDVQIVGPDIDHVYGLYSKLRTGAAVPDMEWVPIVDGGSTRGAEPSNVIPFPRSSTSLKFACGHCGAEYTVSPDKVRGKTVRIACKKCLRSIILSEKTATRDDSSPKSPGKKPDPGKLN